MTAVVWTSICEVLGRGAQRNRTGARLGIQTYPIGLRISALCLATCDCLPGNGQFPHRPWA
jgi:hypothetical protein